MQGAAFERPRFRQDLLAEAIEEHGAKFIDVMDPDSGNVFRFYEVEFSLACAMDGERDVAGIVRWAAEELGVTPSANEVRSVIATLGDLGYLDQTGAAKAAAAEVLPAAAQGTMPAARRPEVAPDTTLETPTEITVTSTPAPTPAPRPRAPTPVQEMEVEAPPGVSEASEVSIDLSAHMDVGMADVQEAVRQSRVMAAVEAPEEAEVSMTADEPTPQPTPLAAVSPPPGPKTPPAGMPVVTTPAAATPPPTPGPKTPPAGMPAVTAPGERPGRPGTPTPFERPVEGRQTPQSIDRVEPASVKPAVPVEPVIAKSERKPPVELPKVPEKQPVPPPAPQRRTNPVLIALLVLVVLGGAAFAVWKFVLKKPSQEPAPQTGSATPTSPAGSAAEAPPPPKPKPTASAKLEMAAAPQKPILASYAGTIEWVEANGKEVKANDIVGKLVGNKPLEAQVAALKKDVDKRKTDLETATKARDTAQAAGDEAAVRKAQAKVDELERAYNTKTDQLHTKTDQLNQFLVRAPEEGTVTGVKKPGDKVPENTQIATLQPPPEPAATFTVPESVKLEVGAAVSVKLGEKAVNCTVVEQEPKKLRVVCPKEPGVVEGAAVTYELP